MPVVNRATFPSHWFTLMISLIPYPTTLLPYCPTPAPPASSAFLPQGLVSGPVPSARVLASPHLTWVSAPRGSPCPSPSSIPHPASFCSGLSTACHFLLSVSNLSVQCPREDELHEGRRRPPVRGPAQGKLAEVCVEYCGLLTPETAGGLSPFPYPRAQMASMSNLSPPCGS